MTDDDIRPTTSVRTTDTDDQSTAGSPDEHEVCTDGGEREPSERESRRGAKRTDGGRVAPDLLPGADGQPLSDITVLELGHIIAGPFCSMLLADLGAEVIKVEHPERGDAVRDSNPVGNSSFNYVNRNKLGVTVDLKSEEGRAVFRDLVREADVLVENYAAGTAERLGVGYNDLSQVNEQLVYCSIKGFNPGPYEKHPALDPVAEALSGLMSVTGHPDSSPVRSGTSVADMAASLYGALTILAAVRQRDATGEGQHINVPLFESSVALMGYWLAFTQAYDEIPEPMGASHPSWAPYDVFRSADDQWVFLGPSSDKQWRRFCDALDVDLHEDDRFETLSDRLDNREVLNETVQSICDDYEADELVERLQEASVPVAPVNDTADVCDDPHLEATNALSEIRATEGDGGRIRTPRFPARTTGFDRVESTDPPALGEDTDAVLAALGYDREQIERLREEDIV